MSAALIRLLLIITACAFASPHAQAAADLKPDAAPRMDFTPLPPGTYQLQKIQSIADASLLNEHGQPIQLRAATTGKITLLTFFYTYCVDPLGCPFARETLGSLRDQILTDQRLAPAVRFVNITCDPTTDTPGVLASYASEIRQGVSKNKRFDWQFLTARSVPALLPVLDDLGQDVSVDVDEHGKPTRALHHMLKVFLIDTHGMVREIYTLAYLQPEVMLNDIRTLVLEPAT
jgi:cytochrome oxidase Cu insertion factor (SCO1/SenC/PrrC family)